MKRGREGDREGDREGEGEREEKKEREKKSAAEKERESLFAEQTISLCEQPHQRQPYSLPYCRSFSGAPLFTMWVPTMSWWWHDYPTLDCTRLVIWDPSSVA